MESGERRAESGERRAESGERRAESGERKAESGGRRANAKFKMQNQVEWLFLCGTLNLCGTLWPKRRKNAEVTDLILVFVGRRPTKAERPLFTFGLKTEFKFQVSL